MHLIRQELDRTVRTISPDLDRRLSRTLGREFSLDRPNRPFVLRPALSFALLIVFSFAIGSLVSKQMIDTTDANPEGPRLVNQFSKSFSQPVLLAQSPQPPREAVHEVVNLNRVNGLEDQNYPFNFVNTNRVLSVDPISQYRAPLNVNYSDPSPLEASPSSPINVSTKSSAPQNFLSFRSSSPSAFSQPRAPEDNGGIRMTMTVRNWSNSSDSDNWMVSTTPSESSLFGWLSPRANLFSANYAARVTDTAGNLYIAQDANSGNLYKISPGGQPMLLLQGLRRPRGLAFDRMGNLYVLESGKGRILRVESVNGAISPSSSISVFALGFSPLFSVNPVSEDTLGPSYLVIDEDGEFFVGDATAQGTVVYKITSKQPTPWWKFFCWYRC